MDEKSSLLSHQIDVVRLLASRFDKITVLTGTYDGSQLPENVSVLNMRWIEGKPLANAAMFYRKLIPLLLKDKPSVLFSHMTEVYSFLALPVVTVLGIPHYLWYAHKSKSFWLRLSLPFLNKIVTSTSGSFPFQGERVVAIGQSIDYPKFFRVSKYIKQRKRLVHVGRTDPSKGIVEILKTYSKVKKTFPHLKLTFIGSATSQKNREILRDLKQEFANLICAHEVFFFETLNRDQIANRLEEFDVFIHAYRGSLDKTLLEATAAGLPVVTVNQEFRIEFGTWSGIPDSDLETELTSCLQMEPASLQREIHRRQRIVLEKHSLDNWINRLTLILGGYENAP